MSSAVELYCLDTNVLIQAWQSYYSPKFCLGYWDLLDEFGSQGKIFISEMVKEEISRTEDDLSLWLKKSRISVRNIDEPVTKCLQSIYSNNPLHIKLVDNIKGRSLADPWVIAHAINENATVVTKEEKITVLSSKKIKIPNVCDNMGINWINDFQLIEKLGIQFSCSVR
jgi:predicted nucleic acid-binding protein